jgi:hypothetical protein
LAGGGETGALGAGVVVVFWTVCVTGAAVLCTAAAGWGVAAGATGVEAGAVAPVGADVTDGVPGRPARATPASAAKQAMTPATRIDRIRTLARVDMAFLFPAGEQISHKSGSYRAKKVEFAGRRRLSPARCDACSQVGSALKASCVKADVDLEGAVGCESVRLHTPTLSGSPRAEPWRRDSSFLSRPRS